MASKGYSDNEAVRSRGQDLASTGLHNSMHGIYGRGPGKARSTRGPASGSGECDPSRIFEGSTYSGGPA